jgi:hypothetical protein
MSVILGGESKGNCPEMQAGWKWGVQWEITELGKLHM